MSVAVLVLPGETPSNALLAGQDPGTFLCRELGPLTPLVVVAPKLYRDLELQLHNWIQEGVREVLLVPGDRPLLTPETLRKLGGRDVSLVILVGPDGAAAAGCADSGWLRERLKRGSASLNLDRLTRSANAPCSVAEDPAECLLVNSLPALAKAERVARERINLRWMQAGVQMIDPLTTYIQGAVTIGRGTVIFPNTHLWGKTAVGEECRLGPNALVRDSWVGNRCVISASLVEEAVMEDESNIGPYGHLRKGAHLCTGAHLGNFGEVKNSVLGPHSKMGHFSYLGDAVVGEHVNIGAGTITCNYDGVEKHKTVIHDRAFIGSDTMLVAPVEIGAGARIGAGSVVTHDIPPGAVAFGVPARVRDLDEEGEGESSAPGE